MKFRELLYEIYKLDWKKTHIMVPQSEVDVLVDFYEDKNEGNITEDMTISEYIEEFGYQGNGLYACYEEFLEGEYTDGGYIDYLIEAYIAENKQAEFREMYETELNALDEDQEVDR